MADLHGFDASHHQPTPERQILPAGKYIAEIVESDLRPTRAGDGQLLEMRLRVVEGPYAGHVLLAWLNTKNPNETAQRIGRERLADICRAVGILQPKDSVELHNLRLQIHVRCNKRKDTGEMVNEIDRYSAAPKEVATGQTSATPPWERTN